MRSFVAGFLMLFVAAAGAKTAPYLPDPQKTPGVTNPDVTQSNIHQTICVTGWTKTIRPKSSFTTNLKKKQIKDWGYSDTKTSSYEEDHLISLQLGGHPTDERNLWPEPYKGACGARTKDTLETNLKRKICKGTITLKDAQQAISKNWVTAYKKYISADGCDNPDADPQEDDED